MDGIGRVLAVATLKSAVFYCEAHIRESRQDSEGTHWRNGHQMLSLSIAPRKNTAIYCYIYCNSCNFVKSIHLQLIINSYRYLYE
jgi:hypothetical protein